jgi:hypothetical protein
VFGDHGKQIAEQRSLIRGQRLGALGEERGGLVRAAIGPDSRVALAVGGRRGSVGPSTLLGAGLARLGAGLLLDRLGGRRRAARAALGAGPCA